MRVCMADAAFYAAPIGTGNAIGKDLWRLLYMGTGLNGEKKDEIA